MLGQVLWMGLVTGFIHFVLLGIMYSNPLVDRAYRDAQLKEPSVRKWPDQKKYLLTQYLGTQIEVFILSLGFVWLRSALGIDGIGEALSLGLFFAALRIYPRFWNMWIQTTYPRRLLAIEAINGTIGTLAVASVLFFLTK